MSTPTPDTPSSKEQPNLNDSPTSTFSASSSIRIDPSKPYRNAFTSTTSNKVFIRADPSLLTCFDPADKELYNLWAPTR
ncbi:hypothetical protein BKA70DRAFT_1419807 [Coprinopsis sp. MPI-PUGE-AT-0042]|nr:hypothetical protein BKA70DRAFT_1419807 [Coprinopsis sp. MPI-PUGE-AT-0042]